MPARAEITPARTESAPRLAPTTRVNSSRIGTTMDPEFRAMARSRASGPSKLPVMRPRPGMRSWITGAETTTPSSTMAMGLPMLASVTSAKWAPEAALNENRISQ